MDFQNCETFGFVVRESSSSEGLVRRYDRAGLIKSERDPYGRRIFPPGTAALVREIKAQKAAKQASAG